MQIKIVEQHLKLSSSQRDLIQKKVDHLCKLASRLDDDSSEVKVDLIHESARRSEDAYQCHLTFFVPHGTLRAESHADSVENAFDNTVGKMKGQIEHYKSKMHRMNKRHAKD